MKHLVFIFLAVVGFSIGMLLSKRQDEQLKRPEAQIAKEHLLTERPESKTFDPNTLIQQLESTQAELGERSILGVVHTLTGEALKGVRVVAYPENMPINFSPGDMEGLSLKEYLEAEGTRLREMQLRLQSAITDDNGDFEIKGLFPDQNYKVIGKLNNWHIVTDSEERGFVGEEFSLIAEPTAPIRLNVSSPSGPPAISGKLLGQTTQNETESSWAQAKIDWYSGDPIAHMPVSWKLLKFECEDGRTSEAQAINLRQGVTQDLTVELQSKGGIYGKVSFKCMTEIRVHCRRVLPGESLESYGEIEEYGEHSFPVSASGQFSIENLDPGSYAMTLMAYGQLVELQVIEVSDKLIEVNFEAPTKYFDAPVESIDASLEVFARDPKGNFLEDCHFRSLYSYKNGYSESGGGMCVQLDSGLYLVHNPIQDVAELDLNYHEYMEKIELICSHFRYGKLKVEIDSNSKVPIEFNFSGPALIHIEMPEVADRNLFNRLQVKARPLGQHYPSIAYNLAERNPPLFGPFQPGPIEIYMAVQERIPLRGYRCDIGHQTIELHAGLNQHKLKIPSLYSLSIQFPRGHMGEIAHLEPKLNPQNLASGLTWRGQLINAFGEISIPYLQERGYELSSSTRSMLLNLKENSHLKYINSTNNALLVQLESEHIQLYKFGLRTGDLIFGVNSEGFRDSQDLLGIREKFQNITPFRILVDRQGEIFEILIENKRRLSLPNLNNQLLDDYRWN